MMGAGVNIGPALGPSALSPAHEQARPGTGGGRPGMQAGALPPRASPAQRLDARPAGEQGRPGNASALSDEQGTPLRPATARAKSKSPKDEPLPARPYTADPAPSMPPPPEVTLTPEASAVEREPAAVQADESPDGAACSQCGHRIHLLLELTDSQNAPS